MKKSIILSAVVAFTALALFIAAQENKAGKKGESGSIASNFIVENFEDAGAWQGSMPIDFGVIRVIRREGAPRELKQESSNANRYVLGARVNYFKSGPTWFALVPPREIQVPGVTKSISVWVSGRNYSHVLKAVVKDFYGEVRYATFGKMNFPGWNKMTAQVSPYVLQDNFKMNPIWRPRGLKIKAMLVECAMEETTGEYFVYLDNMSVTSEMFAEENVDPDDIIDDW